MQDQDVQKFAAKVKKVNAFMEFVKKNRPKYTKEGLKGKDVIKRASEDYRKEKEKDKNKNKK